MSPSTVHPLVPSDPRLFMCSICSFPAVASKGLIPSQHQLTVQHFVTKLAPGLGEPPVLFLECHPSQSGPVRLKRRAVFSLRTQHVAVCRCQETTVHPRGTKRGEGRHRESLSHSTPEQSECRGLSRPQHGGSAPGLLALPFGLSVSPPASSFFVKARMCVQLSRFLSLLTASRIWGVQRSLFILHHFCSFQSKLVMLLLIEYSQRFCGPPVNLTGIYSIR